jgi:hypothetical protein
VDNISYNGGNANGIQQKIMDYIHYSAFTAENAPKDMGRCTDVCGKGLFKQKCCAGITAQRNSSKEIWYACVDRSLAAADMTMNIANFDVNITCVQSGANKIVAITASAILALVGAM